MENLTVYYIKVAITKKVIFVIISVLSFSWHAVIFPVTIITTCFLYVGLRDTIVHYSMVRGQTGRGGGLVLKGQSNSKLDLGREFWIIIPNFLIKVKVYFKFDQGVSTSYSMV